MPPGPWVCSVGEKREARSDVVKVSCLQRHREGQWGGGQGLGVTCLQRCREGQCAGGQGPVFTCLQRGSGGRAGAGGHLSAEGQWGAGRGLRRRSVGVNV